MLSAIGAGIRPRLLPLQPPACCCAGCSTCLDGYKSPWMVIETDPCAGSRTVLCLCPRWTQMGRSSRPSRSHKGAASCSSFVQVALLLSAALAPGGYIAADVERTCPSAADTALPPVMRLQCTNYASRHIESRAGIIEAYLCSVVNDIQPFPCNVSFILSVCNPASVVKRMEMHCTMHCDASGDSDDGQGCTVSSYI